MKRSGLAMKFTLATLTIALVGAGAGAIYYYTLPSVTSNSANNTATGLTGSTNGRAAVDTNKYLGYIPAGYNLAPHQANAPTFPCPPEMSTSACKLFQQTCGNGVCDPNERCDTCPIDCAPTGNLACDPYTGRPGMPSSICQGAAAANNVAGA
jgi:hypothetical protein